MRIFLCSILFVAPIICFAQRDPFSAGQFDNQIYKRKLCATYAPMFAKDAFKMIQFKKDVITETKGNPKKRAEKTEDFKATLEQYLEGKRDFTMRYRHSENPRDITFGAVIAILASQTISLAVDEINRSESWLQDELFSRCESR